MAIMHIGLSCSLKILVKWPLTIALMSLFFTACFTEKSIPFSTNEEAKLFYGNKIHIEVMTQNGKTQVFYFVNSDELATGLALKPTKECFGLGKGFESLIKEDQEHDLGTGASFSDIIALPESNKNNLLSPRIPNIRTKLSSDQSFKLDLIYGEAYTVILNPSGLYDRAPIFLHVGAKERAVEMMFKEVSNPILRGRLGYKNAPLAFGKNKLPELKAHVVLGNRLISSVGRLNDDGSFALELALEKSLNFNGLPVFLLIEPLDPESGFPHIKRRLKAKEIYQNPEMGIVDVGPLNNPFSLKINVRDEEQKPLSKGELILRAKKHDMEILAKKTLNSSGSVVFDELYEGDYEVAVIPPLASPFGLLFKENINISSENHEPLNLILPKRSALKALVVDEQKNFVEGTLFEFSRIGESGSLASEDIFKDLLFKQTALSNDQGQLCRNRNGIFGINDQSCEAPALDQGRYLVHIIPKTPKLSQAWATFDFPDDRILEFNLTKPKKLRGKILTHDRQNPAPKAYVTIYWADSDLYNQPKVIATALCDEQGYFEVFVPDH